MSVSTQVIIMSASAISWRMPAGSWRDAIWNRHWLWSRGSMIEGLGFRSLGFRV